MAIEAPGKRYGKRLQHSKVFGHGLHGTRTVFADLNVTPLVDMFVILVLFLIANFSATGDVMFINKEVRLPESANTTGELSLAPVIIVTREQVLLSGALIGRVEDLTRDDYLDLPALGEKLREAKHNTENLHSAANDAEAFKGEVNIQADKAVPFRIIKRVMYTCASTGYGNISFATLMAGSKTASRE